MTEADRLRLRVEIDALCADLYGLDPDDFDWIVRDDPTDPKGFYRVDRQLPFRERLTGLAAAAFRALKDGKWSAEVAANLSNDEFFDILGIPELTNADAAKAKGLPGPLIPSATVAMSGSPRTSRPTIPATAGPGTTAGRTPWPCSAAKKPSRSTWRGNRQRNPNWAPVGDDDKPFQLRAEQAEAETEEVALADEKAPTVCQTLQFVSGLTGVKHSRSGLLALGWQKPSRRLARVGQTWMSVR